MTDAFIIATLFLIGLILFSIFLSGLIMDLTPFINHLIDSDIPVVR